MHDQQHYPLDHRSSGSETAPVEGSQSLLSPLHARSKMLPNASGDKNVNHILQPSGRADSEDGLFDWHRFKLFFFRRRKTFISTFLIAAALGAIITLLLRPMYEGTAILLASTLSPRNGGANELPVVSYFLEANRARSQKTQIDILSSPLIAQGALQRLPISDRETVGTYSIADGEYSSASLTISSDRDSEIITVSAITYTPQAAAALANAICNEYIAQSRKQNQQQARSATQYVQQKLGLIGSQLNRARENLRHYKERNQTVDLSTESENLVQQLSQLQVERRQNHADKIANMAELESLKRTVAGMRPTQIMPNMIVRKPSIEAKKVQLTQLEMQRLNALQEYTPTSPIIRKLEGQIAALREQLGQEAQTEIGNWQNQVNPVRLGLVQDTAKLQGQVWALESRGPALDTAIRQVTARMAQLPEREQRLSQLSADLNSLQQIYQMLNGKYQELRISEEARVADAQMVSPAQVADKKTSPRYGRSLAVAFIVALMLSLGVSVLADKVGNHLHSQKDIEVAINVPVLCTIPLYRKRTQQILLDSLYGEPHLLESYRRLRTYILSSSQSNAHSILITSSVPSEGKSAIALNLAVVAAMSGKRVVLIDSDLRSPSLHKLLELPNNIGFTNIITGVSSLSEALQQTKLPNLQVLTSGPLLANAPEWLNSPAICTCLQEIKERVDLLVIDSSPILVTVDSQILARQVDAVLLAISCQEPTKTEVMSAMQLLTRDGTNVIGVVLNKQIGDQKQHFDYHKYQAPTSSNPENDINRLLKATSPENIKM